MEKNTGRKTLYLVALPDFFSDQINKKQSGQDDWKDWGKKKLSVVLRCQTARKGTTWKNRCASENNIKMELK